MVLTTKQRNAYASGAFTKSLLWNFTDLLLLFYLSEIQSLGAANAGVILLISLLVSGIMDISLALILDRYNLHYPHVIAFGAPVAVGAFAVLFSPIEAAADFLFIYYLVATILFRIGYALVDIPHNAMLGSLTSNGQERTQLSSSRIFFNASAILLFAGFTGDSLALLESGNVVLQLVVIATCALVMLCNIYACIIPVWAASDSPKSTTKPPLRVAFTALMRNKAFRVLALFALLPSILIPVFYKSGVYFAVLLLHDKQASTWLIMSLALGKLLALPCCRYFGSRLEKHQAMIISLVGMIAVFTSFVLVRPNSLAGVSLHFLACGIFFGGLSVLIWSSLPDTVEYGLAYTGVANQALTFGAFHLVMRISGGLSFVVIATAIESARLVPHGPIQPEYFVVTISLLAGVGALLGILTLWFYPITHQTHQETVQSLKSVT